MAWPAYILVTGLPGQEGDDMEGIMAFLPKRICDALSELPEFQEGSVEEIRIRTGRPLEIIKKGSCYFSSYQASAEDAFHILNKIGNFSMYTLEEELRQGYITVSGGHRIGLAGKVILESGKVKAIRDVSSFNIRIAREKLGAANQLLPYVYKGKWLHTMVIGPPHAGKTTLLRDLARLVSTGEQKLGIKPVKTGIVDERSEIAGCVHGIPQLTLGPRVDILDACPKAAGMMMMIRSMSPEVLIVDEIGKSEETSAIIEAANAGITLMMTTHGNSLAEITKRPSLIPIIEAGIFQRYITMSGKSGPGTITAIEDAYGQVISSHQAVNIHA